MLGGKAGPRKLDLGRHSMVQASAVGLWPHFTDVTRWPSWLKDRRGGGLAHAERLPVRDGTVDPLQPELGRRFRLRFHHGFEGEFQVTYWLEPAQISLGLVKDTRKDARGIEGLIFDLDFFPRPDGSTQVWFTALVLLERGTKASPLARWPKREVRGWVDGFHDALVREGPRLAGGVTTRKQAEAAAAASSGR